MNGLHIVDMEVDPPEIPFVELVPPAPPEINF